MRILMIRHAEPDYKNDTLTQKGVREAELLADTAKDLELGDCYSSPMGRAKETAQIVTERVGKSFQILPWLHEFQGTVTLEGSEEMQQAYPDAHVVDGVYQPHIVWDCLPSYWTEHPECFDPVRWRENEVVKRGNFAEAYDNVTSELDDFLASYGYVRENGHYRVEQSNMTTVTFFCHLGVTCMILSHLWGISPFILPHALVPSPTSVTEVFTEEREKGSVFFRATRIGDISHLNQAGEKPSYVAKFCEVYENWDERH